MKTLLLSIILVLPVQLMAQLSADLEHDPHVIALRAREALAESIAKGATTPEAAIAEVRSAAKTRGRDTDADAETASAMIDLGHRLMALDKPEEAHPFFAQAEEVLERVALKEREPKQKARHLLRLAALRVEYLDKPELGFADAEAAVALEPEDKSVLRRAKQVEDRGGKTLRDAERKIAGKKE